MLGFLRWFSLWRIVLLAVLYFMVLRPLVWGTYSQVLAFYWWMRP